MRASIHAFKRLSDSLNRSLTGVEVGVWEGINALAILKNVPISMLYLVDPYEVYDEFNVTEISGAPNQGINEAKARNITTKYKKNITFIKRRSHDAISVIPNELDFAYLDGNKNHKYVVQDLEDYYPKIAKGGILAGHDFHYAHIRKAVDEYIKGKNLTIWSYPFKKENFRINWDEAWPVPNAKISMDDEDWWIIKNECSL